MERKTLFALLAGGGLAATGLWAFAAPSSFYSFATYPPYSPHFIRDAGSFLLGLGAVLMIAGFVRDGFFVAVAGNAVGAWFHVASHVVDRSLGGGSWRDPIVTLVFAVALTAAAWKWRPNA